MSLKSTKQIPKLVKDCVYGYNHQIIKRNIPLLIQNLCLLYFYERDFIQKAHNLYKISQDKKTVKKINTGDFYKRSWCHTILCNQWFNSMCNKIIKWKFHINDSKYCAMAFILITKDKGCDYNYQHHTSKEGVISTDVHEYNYAHLSSGYTKENGVGMICLGNQQQPYTSGNNILYTLDLKQSEWRCKINDDEEFLVSNIKKADDIDYKLAISMLYQNTSVTLTDFCWTFAR